MATPFGLAMTAMRVGDIMLVVDGSEYLQFIEITLSLPSGEHKFTFFAVNGEPA